LGIKRPSKKIKAWQTTVLWRLSSFLTRFSEKAPLLSKYSARSAHEVSKYSSEKIKQTMNFQFEEIQTVVKDVCSNFKK